MYGQMHDVEFVFKDVHGKIIGELQPKIHDLLTEKRPKIWPSGISSLLCHQNSYNSWTNTIYYSKDDIQNLYYVVYMVGGGSHRCPSRMFHQSDVVSLGPASLQGWMTHPLIFSSSQASLIDRDVWTVFFQSFFNVVLQEPSELEDSSEPDMSHAPAPAPSKWCVSFLWSSLHKTILMIVTGTQ
jgi:hypothetical protein